MRIAIITLPAALLSAAVAGQDAKIITVSDEVSPVPGAALISDYHGPVPTHAVADGNIPQMPGFPVQVGGHGNFAPSRGLVFADLDSDGDLEIVTSSTDGFVYAWDNAGNMMPGFPINVIELPQYAPSVDDLDGDGDVEIVQFTRGLTSGGRMYIFDHLGNTLPGFPLSLSNNNIASCPTMYDLDGDGVMEILAGERAYPIGYLRVIEIDGTQWGGNWPVVLDHVPTGSAAVGDVDDDGAVEIFYMSYDSMYLLETDGTALAGWPKQIPSCNFSYQSAALADLDGDGDLEIVVGAHKNAAGCYVFHHDGTSYPGWPKYYGTWTYCPPTVTDLEGDGELEILGGRAGYVSGYSDCFWAWTSAGAVKPGFPYGQSHGGGSEGPLTTADINGDGVLEIFADHNIMVEDKGFLFGVDANGADLPGFPLRPPGFTYMNGATVGDVDNDGDFELGVVAYSGTIVSISLYDLPDMSTPTDRDWKVYHARNRRGGWYPVASPCPADVNGDKTVNLLDLLAVLAAWGATSGPEDINGDGVVNVLDLLEVLGQWGPC
jgi:hypothetical protein